MESYELAPVAARIGWGSVFLQRTRHLLRDRQKEGVRRSEKSRVQNRRGDSSRQRIVEAARAHFFSHGFRSVTMDDLAAELGISKKTLYAYFPGKLDLLEAVLADKFQGVEAMLKQVTRAQPHDFPATLRDLLAGTQRELDEIKPPFVRDMRQKAPQVFQVIERRR